MHASKARETNRSSAAGEIPDQGWFVRPILGQSAPGVRRADTPDSRTSPVNPALPRGVMAQRVAGYIEEAHAKHLRSIKR